MKLTLLYKLRFSILYKATNYFKKVIMNIIVKDSFLLNLYIAKRSVN
jgi:hypothetical protein